VVDDPVLPIVAEGDEEPNDTYVAQLVAGAEAAARDLADRGWIDPDRLLVGGHSYGAFTTANLLAHTDLFRAGIARSGAYNRTLTPFGFQGEERSFWEAPETYVAMAPFTVASRVDEPLLLIHGADDANAGTWPVQSERFYEALKGQGATARWVELPAEDHGYRARESVGHVLWEMFRWADTWVLPEPPPAERPEPPSGKPSAP
jgi:dipeptidyl aminopeptidase/acylaminoacyl peptidase